MNYELLIDRAIDGLTIIADPGEPGATPIDPEVGAHSFMLFVPAAVYAEYTDVQVEDLKEMGWTWLDGFGWILPTVG